MKYLALKDNMRNIIISNKNLEIIKEQMIKEGKNKFHVIADFDRTLTKSFYRGEKAKAIIHWLRNGRYLTKDYAEKAHTEFDKYHPIEINPDIPIKEKREKMQEWWDAHFNLLIKSGLDKKTIEKSTKEMIKEDFLDFRKGVKEFFKMLKDNNIPLIIMSSSVGDVIIEFMKQKKVYYDNIYIISNLLEFDKNGKSTGIKEIVHVFNKHEIELKSLPIYKGLLERKNVLLLGDSLGDLGMIKGFPYDNLIKVGFLNEEIDNNLENFKKNYDVLILNDGDFDYVNKLIKEVIK